MALAVLPKLAMICADRRYRKKLLPVRGVQMPSETAERQTTDDRIAERLADFRFDHRAAWPVRDQPPRSRRF
jgi:hypothetical protein